MNIPKNHHFVPESYLQFFSFNEIGDLFTHKPKFKYPNGVRKFNKSAICYSIDLYKLDKQLNDDEYLIEKEKFHYEKSFIKNIITKVNKFESLNDNEYFEIVKMILNIKNRNITLYNQFHSFSSENIDAILKDISGKLNDNFKNSSFIENIYKIAKDEALKNLNDKNKSKMILNESFLKILNSENDKFNYLESFITSKKYKIFYSDDTNSFITSDNPGHTIHKNGIVGNLNFGSAEAFFFHLVQSAPFLLM